MSLWSFCLSFYHALLFLLLTNMRYLAIHWNNSFLIHGENSPVAMCVWQRLECFLHTLASILTAYHYLTARPKQSLYLSLFWGQKEFPIKGNGFLVSSALGRRTKKVSETISWDPNEQFQPYLLVFGISTANLLWNAAMDMEIISWTKPPVISVWPDSAEHPLVELHWLWLRDGTETGAKAPATFIPSFSP